MHIQISHCLLWENMSNECQTSYMHEIDVQRMKQRVLLPSLLFRNTSPASLASHVKGSARVSLACVCAGPLRQPCFWCTGALGHSPGAVVERDVPRQPACSEGFRRWRRMLVGVRTLVLVRLSIINANAIKAVSSELVAVSCIGLRYHTRDHTYRPLCSYFLVFLLAFPQLYHDMRQSMTF